MNLISKLLTKYSFNKLSIITGVSIAIMKDLRAGKIPDNISICNGKYIAAKSVLEKQIKASISEYRIRVN